MNKMYNYQEEKCSYQHKMKFYHLFYGKSM